MEMVIVNRFSYPPVTLVDEEVRSQMVGKEMQMGLVSSFIRFANCTIVVL